MPASEPASRFSCPVCPSTNNLFRGRRWKTDEYREWITRAGWAVKLQRPAHVAGRVKVELDLPFGRHRDIDNCKAALDLVATLGIIENDNRIDELVIRRAKPGGDIMVAIWPISVPAA